MTKEAKSNYTQDLQVPGAGGGATENTLVEDRNWGITRRLDNIFPNIKITNKNLVFNPLPNWWVSAGEKSRPREAWDLGSLGCLCLV